MSTLRQQLKAGGIVVPGAHDALSAVLAERAGFEAVYLSGFAFEATQLGAPDMALSTMPELAAHAARMVEATNAAVICDIDTGFGGPNSVRRTIRSFERAGVAAVQIEDQAEPKRCPFLGGRKVLERSAAVGRVRTAVEARRADDLLIIARTDADGISTQEVVERSRLYAEAGADLVMPMVRNLDGRPITDRTPAERMEIYADLARRIDHPMVALDPPPGFTPQDVLDVGVAMVVMPLASLEAGTTALIDYYDAVHSRGDAGRYFAEHPKKLPADLQMMRVLGLDDYLRREMDAAPADQTA
ncbi:isocitrate lyase/PEP mutase family protein [Pseudarthrobacter sp902506025]|uniref:isocitrate lyase/PEP mutase family protein n=1 Tax=Pseudarthrobacter sp. 902506025 TaxID=3155291 RepID=UPI0034503610